MRISWVQWVAVGLLLATPIANAVATAERPLGPVAEKSALTVAIAERAAPVFFVDPDTGEAKGFAVDVIRAIGVTAGFDMTFRVYPTSAEAEAAVLAGEADIVPSAAIPHDGPQPMGGPLMTSPYHTFRASLFVREGYSAVTSLGDFPAGRLGIGARPPIRNFIEDQGIGDYVPFSDPEAGVLALLSSNIDGLIFPEEMFRFINKEWTVDGHFRREGRPLFEVQRGIMVRPDLPGVHAVLDNELKTFAQSSAFSRMFMKWFGEPVVGPPILPLIGTLLATLMVAATGFFLWRHKKEIDGETGSTREPGAGDEALDRRTVELRRGMEERLRAECGLQESERRYGSIFAGSQVVMMLIDPEDGAIVDANPSACEFYGYPHEQLTKKKVGDLNLLPPDELKARLADAVSNKKHRFLFQHRLASGEIRHIDGRPTSIEIDGKKYIFSIVIDVTEQVRAETALREKERLLQAILDNSPAVIHLKDRDGRFVLVNARFLDRHGLSTSEVLGKCSHDLLPAEFADLGVRRDAEVVSEKRAMSYEAVMRTDDGRERQYLAVKFPMIDADGEVFAIGTISNDITDLKQTETALRHVQRLESIGQLTGGIAHDFNNLLGVIIMNLEYLQDVVALPKDAGPAVDAIAKAAWRGADLTKRLLAFSRKSSRSESVVDANDLIAGMREMLERTLTESFDVQIDLAQDLWPVDVEEGDLADAILNLAINSRDAMPQGGKLTITTKNVTLGNEWVSGNPDLGPGEYVLIEVADNGPGMSREVIERAFEPFFTTKPPGEGTGLGLSMVYGFVRRSKGDVRIFASRWQGTRVQILLPRSTRSVAEADEPEQAEPRPKGSEIILVVDDEAAIREIICHQLRGLGYGTCTAANGAEAMEILRTDTPIDLLLCDVIMPGGLSGDQVAAKARSLRPDMKVILVSGYTKNLDEINRSGIAGEVLLKPFTAAELASRVRETLDSRAQALAD